MGLLIIKGRDGKPRPTWYGRISVKGKRRDANLGVPIEGTIPMSDQGAPVWTVKGDAAFERSKRAAQKALADAIEGAGFTDEKRNRVLDVYAQFKAGARCIDIAAALGVARSQVSMDLRDAERLTGENLRPRSIAKANRASRLDLIERTRAARGVGKRAASLYDWHSLRATFVVLAIEAGVPLPDVQKIVGHSTAEMTLQYFNPTAKHTAERVRKQMRGTVLDGRRNRGMAIDLQETAALPDASAVAPVARQSVDALIAGLTDDQRKELARKLLGL